MHATPTNICTNNWAWSSCVRWGATCCGRTRENLVREPDAGNPPVRFDEREVETGHGGIFWPRQPKGPATRMAHLNHCATSRLYFCQVDQSVQGLTPLAINGRPVG